MSFVANWDYTLTLAKPTGYGQQSLAKRYNLNTLLRADMSKATAGSVDEASIQLSDPGNVLYNTLSPSFMDVIRFSTCSPYDPTQKVIWTGLVDTASKGMDASGGDTLVLSASSPFKLWEKTEVYIPPPGVAGPSDVAALAVASLRGVGARDLIAITGRKVGYPGPLGALPNPAGYHMYAGPELVGQRSLTMPDVLGSEQPTYGSILEALVSDTGMELFFDEFGSLIFRPIQYLTLPNGGPVTLTDEDFYQATFSNSDDQPATEIRVRWATDYNYQSDGWAAAPSALGNVIGYRPRVIQAPWIFSRDSATFLARALMQMYAANIDAGTVTIAANPLIRVGTVIRLIVDGVTKYYYVGGIVWSLEWGRAWTMTLQLAYGRDQSQAFPLIGQQAPLVASTRDLSGISAGSGGLAFSTTGTLTTPYTLAADKRLGPEQVTGPYPPGTVLRLTDPQGNVIGPSRSGKYVVSTQTTTTTLTLASTGGETSAVVTVVKIATEQDPTTASPANTNLEAAPSTSLQDQSGGKDNTFTGGTFPYFPIKGGHALGYSQKYGATGVTSEPPGCGYDHYHTGVDIPAPSGTPIIAPADGTVTYADWDTSGYGNMTLLQISPTLTLLFGHQQSFNVKKGDHVTAGAVIGYVDSTGNSTGPHLHLGVKDMASGPPCANYYVDPAPYLVGAPD